MLASHVNDSNHLRERAAEMRASSKDVKDNNTAAAILRLAELYDRLADRAEIRSNGADGFCPGLFGCVSREIRCAVSLRSGCAA
jgi:hypothetical protein